MQPGNEVIHCYSSYIHHLDQIAKYPKLEYFEHSFQSIMLIITELKKLKKYAINIGLPHPVAASSLNPSEYLISSNYTIADN